MEAPVGKILGRYEIVAEQGRGAMGTVYKARDPKIDRFVAIKTILLHQIEIEEQREFRARFFVEAQAAGRLLHPGIVAVFDVGEDPETSDPYIVMEYIEGQTLQELLSENGKRLPLNDALRITLEIAEALDYAHAQGVVHRDIKPANILITKEGQAKIGDFGIAQLDLAHMTVPGRVIGTPAYMSPEQLEGGPVDGRSDLFSLGGILYSAVTGFSPFQGNNATAVCFQVANREPLEATALDPDLPAELDTVIARALAKDPAARYQRGLEFARDVRQLRERAPTPGKGKLWFSASEGRQRFLDTIKIAITNTRPVLAAKTVPAAAPASAAKLASAVRPASAQAPPPSRQKARNVLSMVSPRVQMGAAVSIFLAALILNYISWRQLRKPEPGPASVVENANLPKGIDSTHEKGSASLPGTEIEAPSDTKNENEAVASVATPVPKTAPRTRSKPAAHATPMVATSAGPTDAGHASSKIDAVVPKSVAKGGVAPVVAKAVPNADRAAQVPQPANPVPPDSDLEIRIDNHFADATLAIWIDDKLAYEHALRDGHKKRLILLGGGVKEKVTIPLSSGQHALRVQVRSASEQYDESKAIAGAFDKGGGKILSINFEKHTKEMRLTLGAPE
ncbi:MAG: protein kinase [Terriglobales bacterium]